MPLYLIRRWEGQVKAREHKAIAWVKPARLDDYPMPPADAPLVAWLRDVI
jgi:8-oxo-dGTP diphosphatase